MRAINRMGCRVVGRMRGKRSNYARLTLTGFNPGHLIFLDALRYWARAVWDGALPEKTLTEAWFNAQKTAGLANAPMQAA